MSEYLCIAVVALFILGGVATLLRDPISTGLSSVICRVLHTDGPCAAATQRHGRTFAWAPSECVRTSADDSYGLRFDVDFVSLGGGLKFMKSTTADGRVRLTALDSATVNALAQQGGRANWRRMVNFSASHEAAAGVTASVGDTWTFPNEAAAQRFESQIKRLSTVEAAKHVPGISLAAKGYEKLFPTRLPRPDVTREEVGVHGYYSANLGLGPGNGKGSKRFDRMGKHEKPSKRDLYGIPTVFLGAGVNVEHKGIYEHDRAAGTHSLTYAFTLAGTLNAGTGQYPATGVGTMRVTRDRSGRIVDFQVATDGTRGSTANVTTFDLKPENDADRTTIEEWLNSGDGSVDTQGSLKKLIGGLGEADERIPYVQPGTYASPFDRLLYQKGRFMRQTYDHSQYSNWTGAGGGDGPELGLYYLTSGDARKLRSAQYLSSPDAAGVRHFQSLTQCR